MSEENEYYKDVAAKPLNSIQTNPVEVEPLSPTDERTWAMIAHLSMLLNLVTGFLGVGAALAIYLVYKDRSRYVAYQAIQSFLFQLIFWVGGWFLGGLLTTITWTIVGMLFVVVIGIILVPIAIVLTLIFFAPPVIAIVYSIIGGIRCSNGEDFRYWLVSEWALSMI
ncbi:MAG: DUF4870 domain-containing protein [Anaerolineae bacterium]|nr:DUF4870 domain-containing protein [Anaerolineae bacterium]